MDNIIPQMVYQAETNECALACLSMLAETQGLNAPLEELRERFPASAHGTALSTMCDILAELAIPAYPVAFDLDEIAETPFTGYFALWRESLCAAGISPGQLRVRDEPGDW